jgi:hypothetical protein
VLEIVHVPADGSKLVDFHDALILGQSDAIAVEFDSGSASQISISLIGFYDVE